MVYFATKKLFGAIGSDCYFKFVIKDFMYLEKLEVKLKYLKKSLLK